MKISETITELTKIMAKHGDLDVVTPGLDESGHDNIIVPIVVKLRRYVAGQGFQLVGEPMVMVDWTPIHGNEYVEVKEQA